MINLSKYSIKQYSLIFLTATIFLLISVKLSFSKENIFFVENIEVSKQMDTKFSRDKAIEYGLKKAFKKLLLKVLLSKDQNKIKSLKSKELKKLVNSFVIRNESFNNNEYRAMFDVIFKERDLSIFLEKKGLLFSNPKKISLLMFPIFIDNEEIKIYDENIFFKKWDEIYKEQELINFILPIEDLVEVSDLQKFKNSIEDFEIQNIAKKYNTNNYVISIIELNNEKLDIFLKMNLTDTKYNKSIIYENNFSIDDENQINQLIKTIKLNIIDTWKKVNLINYSTPLSLEFSYKNIDLKKLYEVEELIKKIATIKNYSIKQFSLTKTIFKIEYFGSPKKLYKEFEYYNYSLKEDKGVWFLKKYE